MSTSEQRAASAIEGMGQLTQAMAESIERLSALRDELGDRLQTVTRRVEVAERHHSYLEAERDAYRDALAAVIRPLLDLAQVDRPGFVLDPEASEMTRVCRQLLQTPQVEQALGLLRWGNPTEAAPVRHTGGEAPAPRVGA